MKRWLFILLAALVLGLLAAGLVLLGPQHMFPTPLVTPTINPFQINYQSDLQVANQEVKLTNIQPNYADGKIVSVAADINIQTPSGCATGTGIFGNHPAKVTISWKCASNWFVMQDLTNLTVNVDGTNVPLIINSVLTGPNE